MENQEARAFQIAPRDNVATALTVIPKGTFVLLGDGENGAREAGEEIPRGHKVAVRPIRKGEAVIKYGISIGEATEDIRAGQWVHLHCMKSCYDQRRVGCPHRGAHGYFLCHRVSMVQADSKEVSGTASRTL